MIERDKVACIIGEISSASCLTIAQVATRNKTLFINTGGNSDALRGKDCQRYMFHVESQNSMYVKTVGRSFLRDGLVKGKKWYSLTADYAFGHDLLGVSPSASWRPMAAISPATTWCRPTPRTFLPISLKIREAKPDLVVINLAGNQITNFLKQYAEFGLTFPVGGFGFDTALAWAAGKGNFVGTWPVVWHHLLDTPGTKAFVAAFTKKYNKPPENQAWGDYIATKIVAQSINELKSAESPKIIEHFEKGAKFDRAEDASGLLPRIGSSADARNVCGDGAACGQDQEPVGHLLTRARPSRARMRPLEVIASTAGRERLQIPRADNNVGVSPSGGDADILLRKLLSSRHADPCRIAHQRATAGTHIMSAMLLTQQILNGLLDGVYYLLIALGLSLIFSLGGIVNLAHGAFYAIGAYLTLVLSPYIGFGGAFVVAPRCRRAARRGHRAHAVPALLSRPIPFSRCC